MKYVSYFRANAQGDLEAAHAWYEKPRAGLGDEFCEALEKAVDRIEQYPAGCAKV